MKMIRFVSLLGVVSALLLFVATAHAEMYAVDFNGYYPGAGVEGTIPLPDNNAFGPPGAVQNNWNQFDWGTTVNQGGGSKDFAMLDSNLSNPLTLHVAMRNQGGNDGGGSGATDIDALYHSGLRDNDGIITLTTATAPFPGNYDLYIYSGNNPNGGVFTQGVNYSKQTVSGPLNFQMGSLNGFSIVGVPEPGTLILLGMGGLGLGYYLWRRRK